jgi:hypothetical protein
VHERRLLEGFGERLKIFEKNLKTKKNPKRIFRNEIFPSAKNA